MHAMVLLTVVTCLFFSGCAVRTLPVLGMRGHAVMLLKVVTCLFFSGCAVRTLPVPGVGVLVGTTQSFIVDRK